jgi:ATP-binding cassette subfamily F protein uup
VVSHDRYFLERVTDTVWALLGDGQISMLPRGVDEYLERRREGIQGQHPPVEAAPRDTSPPPTGHSQAAAKPRAGSAEERAARKTIARLDKQLERVAARQAELDAELAAHLSDHVKLAELGRQAAELAQEREALELEWLEAAEVLD